MHACVQSRVYLASHSLLSARQDLHHGNTLVHETPTHSIHRRHSHQIPRYNTQATISFERLTRDSVHRSESHEHPARRARLHHYENHRPCTDLLADLRKHSLQPHYLSLDCHMRHLPLQPLQHYPLTKVYRPCTVSRQTLSLSIYIRN